MNLRQFIFLLAFLFYAISGSSCSEEYSCSDALDKTKLLREKPNCGDGQCKCEGTMATCVGNWSVTMLPTLPSNINILYVFCYGISVLDNDTITNIKDLDLKELHLLKNGIKYMAKDIFGNFRNLSEFDVSENMEINVTSLKIALGSIQKLSPVSLTFNNIGISIVTIGFFHHMNTSNIIGVTMEDNRIETLNLTAFSSLPFLQELRLAGNWINNFTGEHQLKALRTLDLAFNHLHSRTANFCQNGQSIFPNIKELLLSNNFLTFDVKYNLSWSCLDTLEYLNMRNNTIKELAVAMVTNMVSLKKLDLGSNWIRTVERGQFPPHLEEIDFRNNQFITFAPELCGENMSETFDSVTKLNFSRNYIQKLKIDKWSCLPNITSLDFSKNDVSELLSNSFSMFTSLKELYLDNMIQWVKRIEPAAFNITSLETLSLRFNWIDFSRAEFHSIFKLCPNVKFLDISYNYLTPLNESTIVKILSPMTNLEKLKAQRISLKTFPTSFLLDFKKLRYLDINRNIITTISFPKEFENPALNLSIRTILVAEGAITDVDQTAFPLSIRKSLETLDLSDNMFACNCRLIWFRDQNGSIGDIHLQGWPDRYVCKSPYPRVNTLLKDYDPMEECSPISPVVIALIAVGCSLFVFAVLSGTAYYNRWYLQYYWYRLIRHRWKSNSTAPEGRPLLDPIKYDGYVIYNQDDDMFVHHKFRSLLEEKLNYKLHIWKRNAEHGHVVDVVLDAMYASRYSIVIVSNKLIKDPWCKFQVDVAIERSIELGENRVLLVLLDDIDMSAVSKTWCVLLAKTPKAYWSSNENDEDIKSKFLEFTIKQHLGKPKFKSSSNGCVNNHRRYASVDGESNSNSQRTPTVQSTPTVQRTPPVQRMLYV